MMKYYGDNFRWFVADVIDTTPPYGFEGRVRVRIHGVHNPSNREVKQNDLPWAQCILPTTEGGVSGIGSTPKLEAGSLVFGLFMDGKESQVPVVIGSLPRTEFPSSVQLSLAYQDLLERVNPDIDFYNQSTIAVDDDNPALDNYTQDPINSAVSNARRDTAVRFFLSNGYTIKQSCAIVGCISQHDPSFSTTVESNGTGLLGWSDVRFTRLKQFNNNWWWFSSQLAFILFELNTTHVDANIRILNSDIIDPAKGKSLGQIIGRYYAPVTADYTAEVSRIYSLYKNSDI
mgnify:CR=1 FL=1